MVLETWSVVPDLSSCVLQAEPVSSWLLVSPRGSDASLSARLSPSVSAPLSVDTTTAVNRQAV